MRQKFLISLVLLAIIACISTLAYSARGAVMLEIIEGDTAFMVDEQAHKAWWIVGECRRPIPLEGKRSKRKKTLNNSMTSEVISNDVQLGSRQIRLEQQFRFNLANTPASVEVYNSMRGGWSSVPVQANSACLVSASCNARMELPEC